MLATVFAHIKSLMLIAIGLFGIGFLIGFHEFGHYLFARFFGVRVPSFSIGMGPRLFSFHRAGTEFKFSAIPLGGYVEIAGLVEVGQGDQEQAHAIDAGSFMSKPYWQKACILSGGVLFNMLMAYLVFVGLFFVGMPLSVMLNQEKLRPVIQTVEMGGVAEKMTLLPGDLIVSIDDIPTPSIFKLREQLAARKEAVVCVTVERNGVQRRFQAPLEISGRLGIAFVAGRQEPLSLVQSVLQAALFTWQIVVKTAQVFFDLFKQRSMKDLGGPLEIISQMTANAKQGLIAFLFLLAFISINLAVLNLIPLPITDGGQLVLQTIESIIRRPIPETIKLGLYYVSWGLIIILTLHLTIKDSMRLFWPTLKKWFVK